MNQLESRFLRLKRYSSDDIEQIHHKERNADARWREYSEDTKKRGDGWLVEGIRLMSILDTRLGPYWDHGKPDEEKAREISAFQACPVVRREFAKLDASELDELSALHQADWAIYKSGYAPNFGKGSSSNRIKLAEMYAQKSVLPYKDSD